MTQYSNEDRVNHPRHYGGADDPYETIKVLQNKMTPQAFAGYLEGCARKYLDRHLKKEGLVDVEKALWFVTRLRDFLRESGYSAVYGAPDVDGVSCVLTKAERLAMTVGSMTCSGSTYADFYGLVAKKAQVTREEAEIACIELGYDRYGKRTITEPRSPAARPSPGARRKK